MRDRYTAADTIQMQQLLGTIYDSEVDELNRVFGGSRTFYRNKATACELYTKDSMMSFALLAAGLGFAAFGKFGLKSNWLWFGAGLIPCSIH